MTPDDAALLDREARRGDPAAWSARSNEGMVVAAHWRATAAGVGVLEAGGNAVDAAVAVSAALGVCEPAASGIGGMTMMLVHLAAGARTFGIVGACRAPRRATPEEVARFPRRRGYPAVALPTTPAVLAFALREHGTLPAAEVLGPAIALAEEGYPISPMQSRLLGEYRGAFSEGGAAEIFLDPAGEPLAPGAIFRQPVLGSTLRRLASEGLEDFYRGAIAREIAADMEARGGFIRADDLADIPWPAVQDPAEVPFGGGRALTLGPPGGGTALLQMLRLHDALAPRGLDPDSPEAAVIFAEIIRRARRDRRRYRLGLDRQTGAPAPDLIGAEHAERAAASLRKRLGSPGETTHACVADRHGNWVSMTQSIERCYGAGVATPSLGFLYNGFMKTFKVQARRHPYFLRPGGLARSNASPTLVLEGGRPVVALGSTGSERLASGMYQVLVRLRTQDPFAASRAPRLHAKPEGVVLLEADRFSEEAKAALLSRGFDLSAVDPWSFLMGGLHLMVADGDGVIGVAEPRRDGLAAGPGTDVPGP